MAKWAEIETVRDEARHAESARPDLATPVAQALPEGGRAVLAISGGLDSMSLLDVAAGVRRQRGCAITVATFDHATGAHSARATAVVARIALGYGLPVVVGHAAPGTARSEAAWRAARWRFLRSVAQSVDAPVITAHTRDDQIETVLMRAMRGAGARGLAGLRAASMVRRPLLDVRREELHAYARSRSLEWIEDPSNTSPSFLRNRIRRDLLPALARVQPAIDEELNAIGQKAARWREELSMLVNASVRSTLRQDDAKSPSLDVWYADLAHLGEPELGIIWPDLAARAGVTLDRRGINRVVEFTRACETGGRIQLSGGWELVRARDWLELRAVRSAARQRSDAEPLTGTVAWGRWRFSTVQQPAGSDPWRADLRGTELHVRSWQQGDRMVVRLGDQLVERKVKYFLTDAKISGHIRASWPVVFAGDEIVWIPGVRRSDAAAARSGRPVVTYVCDYLDRRP